MLAPSVSISSVDKVNRKALIELYRFATEGGFCKIAFLSVPDSDLIIWICDSIELICIFILLSSVGFKEETIAVSPNISTPVCCL